MEHNRKQKLLMIIALVVGIASLSIGFAAFATTLNISSSASVTPNSDTFSVKFSTSPNSLVVEPLTATGATANVEAGTGTISNATNPTVTGLSASFTRPGEYISYTFYARNEGEYTAYLNNINFIGEKVCIAGEGASEQLVQSACEKVTLYVQVGVNGYLETTPITGHSLAPKASDTIKVILNYESDASLADGPFTVKFQDVAFVYSTIDDSSVQPVVSKVVKLENGNLNDPGSIVSIGNEKFYVIGQENGNVKLLSMYNLHVGNVLEALDSDDNPIMHPISSPTGIQDEDSRGFIWDSVNDTDIFPWLGTVAFSYTGPYYSGSIVEGYVNDYASYLKGIGANIEEARLISRDELESLGCDSLNITCVGAPSWVYSTTYWTGEVFDPYNVWLVNSLGLFDGDTFDYDFAIGVRPVVIISTSEF